jgi:hypothetical protein
MLPPQLGPARKIVLRRGGGHFSLEPDHFGAKAGLFVKCLGARAERCVEGP